MTVTFKVFVYGEEIFTGSINQAIKIAEKENKKMNCNASSIEVWEKNENYFLTSMNEFWH